MDKVKEKQTSGREGMEKIRLADTVKSMPKELTRSVLDDSTQRILTQFRDASQKEEQSDYGGDTIEDAAVRISGTAAYGTGKLLQSGVETLLRRRTDTPPPDDFQNHMPIQDIPPAEAELPPADTPSLPKYAMPTEYGVPTDGTPPALEEHVPALPEHTAPANERPVSTERAGEFSLQTVAENPAQTLKEAPVSSDTLLSAESGVSEISPEAPKEAPNQTETTPKRHFRHTEAEPIPTGKKEESWSPAYRDAPEKKSTAKAERTATPNNSGERTEEPVRESGKKVKSLERSWPSFSGQSDRTGKVTGERNAGAINERRTVREKNSVRIGASTEQTGQRNTPGRQKFIREQGQRAAARKTGAHTAETLRIPKAARPLEMPQIPEPHVRTLSLDTVSGSAPFSISNSLSLPETECHALPIRKEAAVRSKESALPNLKGSTSHTVTAPDSPETLPRTGRVSVKNREALEYQTPPSSTEKPPQSATRGKQNAIRERIEQIAEARTDRISVKRSDIPQERLSVKGREQALPNGRNNTPVSHVTETAPQIKTQTANREAAPPTLPKQERAAVRTRDTQDAHIRTEPPSSRTESSQSASQGRQKVIQERGKQAAEKRTEVRNVIPQTYTSQQMFPESTADASGTDVPYMKGRESVPQSRTEPPIHERIGTTAPEQARLPVKTREAHIQQEAPSSTEESPQSASQGKQKVIQERGQRIVEKQTEVHDQNPQKFTTTTTDTPHIKDRESVPQSRTGPVIRERMSTAGTPVADPKEEPPSSTAEAPQSVSQGKQKIIQERGKEISGKRTEVHNANPQTHTNPQTLSTPTADAPYIKGRESVPQSRTELPIRERTPAIDPKQEHLSVKTREAYVQQEPPFSTADAPRGISIGRTIVREHGREATGSRTEARSAISEMPANGGTDTPPNAPNGRIITPDNSKEFPAIPEQEKPAIAQDVPSIRTKTAYPHEKPTPVTEQPSQTAARISDTAARGQAVPEADKPLIKTRDACVQKQTPSDQTFPQGNNTSSQGVSLQTDSASTRELQKDVKTRQGLIREPEKPSGKTNVRTVSPDGKRSTVSDSHTPANNTKPVVDPVQPGQSTLQPVSEQPVTDIKTRQSVIQKETVRSTEQPERILEQGRQSFVREQKRKADVKQAAERRPKIRETALPQNSTQTVADETKNLAFPAQDQNVKTKDAWLLQRQGKDRPKERMPSDLRGNKDPLRQTTGQAARNTPKQLDKGLPASKVSDSGGILPSSPVRKALPGSRQTDGVPGKSIREPGKAAERSVRKAAGKSIKEAASGAGKTVKEAANGGRKVIKTARPLVIREGGKASGKAVKTAERTSVKAVKTAAHMVQSAKMTAQASAKANALRVAAVRTAKVSAKAAAKTMQEVAKAVIAAAKAAAESLQSLFALFGAGGAIALVVVVAICLMGIIIAAPFGMFFSREASPDNNIQTAVAHLTREYSEQIQQIKNGVSYDTLDMASDITTAMAANWKNVLAVYAVRVTTDEVDATEVVTMSDEKMEILRETFRDMNQLSSHTTSRTHRNADGDRERVVTLHISVNVKNAEEMAEEYHFNARQRELLDELLSDEYSDLFDSLIGGASGGGGGGSPSPGGLSPEELEGILVLIPENLSEQRRQVILTGAQLLGKVHYFWGGKSLVLGWDSRWGTPTRVWAAGSPSTGTVRPFGLDCSGFVDWVFYNVSGGTYVIGHGGGASAQHSYCTTIPWSQAQPGDLAFYPADHHVGIIVGYDDAGNVKIMHCASGSNNVVVTGKIGFVTAAVPRWYDD